MKTSDRAAAPEFATFWHGPLDALAYGCLASFAHFGARLRLYSYDDALDAPRGVEWADARQICPDPSRLGRYIVKDKPAIAAFADMFRYKMIGQTGCCWVDADILCLAKPDFAHEDIVFGRQPEFRGESLINNAVLKLPPADPTLAELIARAEGAVDVDQTWGAIGPFLLTEIATRNGIDRHARAFTHFYPVEPDHFWKLFLPAYRDEVAEAARGATFLHLWGELIARSGYDRSACPPAGSFLHEAFARLDVVDRFVRVYEAREVEALMAKWISPPGDSPTSIARPSPRSGSP
jgi:hypothetical protein